MDGCFCRGLNHGSLSVSEGKPAGGRPENTKVRYNGGGFYIGSLGNPFVRGCKMQNGAVQIFSLLLSHRQQYQKTYILNSIWAGVFWAWA